MGWKAPTHCRTEFCAEEFSAMPSFTAEICAHFAFPGCLPMAMIQVLIHWDRCPYESMIRSLSSLASRKSGRVCIPHNWDLDLQVNSRLAIRRHLASRGSSGKGSTHICHKADRIPGIIFIVLSGDKRGPTSLPKLNVFI
ncbi:hypothetical protein GYMLUDRAFT_47144 [Collybiopsis luxurians FD-317 M1]|uniref:Uncharacterized protein n=1 Tax=Collybiopsis luxurians FD-317 M1 TaxID=944289 RepID=A0A0D0BN26_9AGAR|nr:hypothetical protein GYMLUDRAFT_47144 [Collybiopsis luxurians FD-317 M1]